MDFSKFYHETKSKYAYAVDLNTLHIRLQTGKDDIFKVELICFDPYVWVKDDSGEYKIANVQKISMVLEQSSNLHDFWFAEISVPTKRCKYGFEVTGQDGEKSFYGVHGESCAGMEVEETSQLYYLFPYILESDLFSPPAWVKDTVWYQIFPERYANSELEDIKKGELLTWGSETTVDNSHLYGGDIPGITANLDDMHDLGITGIYMTPIFSSPSTHKYDTEDYFTIDPVFGTNEHFGELVNEANKRGMRIMLDMVFNHIGYTNPIWLDVIEKGKSSKYFDWFCINEDGTYETFATVKRMPKWKDSNPEAREYLIGVAEYWVKNYKIDGIRLDVANEVSHDFWRAFRTRMLAINPEIYILGEVWDNGMSWLLGDQFDAVMNYPLATAIWQYVSGETSGADFRSNMAKSLVMYPHDRQKVMFNLLGTHDTGRILTLCNGIAERVKQAFAVLLTSAGSPMILYGDEVGISGDNMDDTRKCMIWDKTKRNNDLRTFVQKLLTLRCEMPDMKSTFIEWLKTDDEGVIYKKGKIVIFLNGKDELVKFKLPTGIQGRLDLITGNPVAEQTHVTLDSYGVALWEVL